MLRRLVLLLTRCSNILRANKNNVDALYWRGLILQRRVRFPGLVSLSLARTAFGFSGVVAASLPISRREKWMLPSSTSRTRYAWTQTTTPVPSSSRYVRCFPCLRCAVEHHVGQCRCELCLGRRSNISCCPHGNVTFFTLCSLSERLVVAILKLRCVSTRY